jgi:hypothetical protein
MLTPHGRLAGHVEPHGSLEMMTLEMMTCLSGFRLCRFHGLGRQPCPHCRPWVVTIGLPSSHSALQLSSTMAPSARSSGYSTPRSGRTSDDVTRPLRSSSPDHERDDADDGIDSDDAELLAAEAHVGSGAAGIAGAGNGDGRIGGFT